MMYQLRQSLQGHVSSVLLTAFVVHAVYLASGVRIATCCVATLSEERQHLVAILVNAETLIQPESKLGI
jgi:hypothetical protein